MRDTTVSVTKLTKVGEEFYSGGTYVVTRKTADALVAGGYATVLSDESSATGKVSTPAKDTPQTGK